MMVVARRIETEKRLQQPMEAGGPEQVAPPDHVGHFLARIIDRDGAVRVC